MSFVGLHTHSDYSLLDGASQLPDLINRAVDLKMPAIALTDHGVMYGAIELMKVCRTRNIKPIIGNEMYVINGDITVKQKYQKFHQVVLAKNTQGYKNLVKLTTISHLEGFQGKGIFARPCINKEYLEKYKEGLIVTSACLGGEVPQAILRGNLDAAKEVAKWYRDVFKDDYYLEIQDHGSQEDRIVNVAIVKIARELGIKIVATNDSHYTSCYDVESHDALLCIQTGKSIADDNRMRYSGTEYLKSAAEMAQLFRDHLPEDVIQEAIANTLEVAEKVEPYHILGEPRLPTYKVPPEHTIDTYLEKETWDGLLKRLGCNSRNEISNEYKERLEYELKIIQQMGFSTYFLVVWDYINFARESNIPVGPGRGSAAGSLVAYCLKITNIDPVHHGLLFERFLNPQRKSMPDIDTDFCIERRDEVIDYVTETYGADKVAQIITFNRLTSKAVLKDVARVLDIPYGEADKLAKLIPVVRGKPTKLKIMISDDTPAAEFKEKYDSDPKVRHWLDMAMRIEGTNKTFGVHAAGVVISSQPLDEIVPLQRNNDGSVITQYFMEDLEALGLLKMDFLGLKNLTTIQKTLDLIKQNHNLVIDPDEITFEERKAQKILAKSEVKKMPEAVEKTYGVLAKAQLEGIFQLESSGMRQVVKDLQPSCIEDISSILALYRPGPLDAGLIPKFINRKHGREQMEYLHPTLEPILEETYAVLVYQEQIMKVAQDLGGYSLGQADLLRRAMGKKKAEEMQKQKSNFIDGCTRNGIHQKIAQELFDQMVLFAEYCFNKSHSTAYAYVTYQTAYLKANYPVEYMAALLTANSGDTDKVQKYLSTCVAMNIQIEPPDVNRSGIDFTPDNQKILFGLSAVRNLGQGAIEVILKARDAGGNFKSLSEFCDRVDLRVVNKKALEALIYSGAFDKLETNRNQSLKNLETIVDWAQSRAKDRITGQGNLLDLLGGGTANDNADARFDSIPKARAVPELSQKERLRFEKEYLGFYVSEHPLKSVHQSTKLLSPISLSEIADYKQDTAISAAVMVAAIKPILTKKGDRMAVLQIEDLTGQAEAVVFPKTHERIETLLEADAQLIVWGKIDRRDDRIQIIVEDAEILEQVRLVMVELTLQQASDMQEQHRLRTILKEHSGDKERQKIPVFGVLGGSDRRQFVRLGRQFWVQDRQAAVEALNSARFSAFVQPLTSL
jgi:DNA polymerase III subunit alpha